MQSLHGIHVHGFPNLFIVGVAQGANLISNIPHNYVWNSTAIAAVIAHAERNGFDEVEVTADAEADWIELITSSTRGLRGGDECTPGYYNNEGGGQGRRELLNGSGHPGGPVAYFEHIEQWRDSGEFAGLEFRGK